MQTLRRIELSMAAAAVILLVLTSLSIIILRFSASSAWSVAAVDTLSGYPSHFMLTAALLGGSLALSRGDTLKIEVLNPLLSEVMRAKIQRVVGILGAAFFIVFIALALRYLAVDYRPIVAFLYLPLISLIAIKLLWLAFQRS